MTLKSIIWHELRSRPASVICNSLAILLGVAALVAIRHVTVHSEQEISQQLADLGANILILPKDTTLQDYYAADQNGATLPEEYVAEIYLAGLTGVEQISPRLNIEADLGDLAVTLTGILPQSDLKAQSAWQTTMLFSAPKEHEGCQQAHINDSADLVAPESLVLNRAIQNLDPHELILGADIAERTSYAVGDKAVIAGEEFTILGLLPPTGTVDDSRVFAHLHTVQELAGNGPVCNAIEVIGCCEDAAGDLVPALRDLLPEAKVVTIAQIVNTQVGVNQLMANTSWFILGVLIVVGGLSLATAIAANVRERRREIGTLMALGATPRFVQSLFLGKAIVLGLCAGTVGCMIGIVTAIVAGPAWAGVTVSVLPATAGLSILIATLVAIASAWWPSRQAARLDPCTCFQEV